MARGEAPGQRNFSTNDFRLLARLPAEVAFAWSLPVDHLYRLTLALARRRKPQLITNRLVALEAVVGGRRLSEPLKQVAQRHAAYSIFERLLVLRCWRPGGWRPDGRLEGREHLDQALAAGRGALLWAGPFVFTPLSAKIVLRQEGFLVTHLSRFTHGFSGTRLGRRVLNPLRTRIEENVLAERVVLPPGDSVGALRLLRRRLAKNRIVSIRALPIGRRRIEVPFLDGCFQVANGAPALAAATGAALLPMLSIAETPARHVTIIEPPLTSSNPDPRGAATELVAQYAAVLERHALRWPDQYSYWYDTWEG